MITLSRKRQMIRWEREDIRLMAKVIGSEHAVIPVKKDYGWAPSLSSIIKLAHRKGVPMSNRALMELEAAEVIRQRAKKLMSLEDALIPDRLAHKYFAHQRADLYAMYELNRPGYLLAHQPGVGKTLPAIRYTEFKEAERIAIITPNAAKDQWRDEIRRWRDRKLPIRILDGTVGEQEHTITSTKRGWVIGHFESLVHAREAWIDDPWDMIIVDEIQYVSSRNAQRTETLHAMKKAFALALGAHPYTNGVNELFPILKFLYPELYPSFWRWAHLQIQIDEGAFGGMDLSSPRRPKLLKWEIQPFMLRRTKKQVWKNLPKITRVRRTVQLSAKGRREYDKLRKQFFVELKAHKGKKNILAIPSVLARITRLRQYLIDPGILGAKEPSVKYPQVLDLVREMEGTPPVIFTMYRQAALRLQAYLAKRGLNVPVIVGGMQKKIGKIKRNFRKGKYDAVIILISVGSTALNFGKYGYVIHLDLPWNPRDYEQTEGRVDRPEEGTGKMVPTTSYRVIVKDSYEERMEEKNRGKHRDFSKVFTVENARELFA